MTFNFSNAPTDYLISRLPVLTEMITSLIKFGNDEAVQAVMQERNAIERELSTRK